MRILWVSQWFPPDLGALPARLTEMAREWTAAGHAITVVAAFPHHPLGVIPESYRGRWVVEENHGGLRVIRCRLWALPNKKMWQRTLCQVSFAVTSVALALARPLRPDVVIVSSPPFFTVPAGWAFSRYHRAPLVFEVRDLWPDVFVASGVLSEGWLFRALRRLEMAFYRAATRVVVVTRAFREDLLARGVPPGKVSVVPNGADLESFAPGPASADLRRRLGGEGRFLATYVGTHGILQGLEQILDAADELRDEPGFAFAFVGEGARRDALGEDAARRRLDRVTFQPALPKAAMPELYATSDACIVCLRPLPIFRKFVPSKIFEILACGRPLIAAVEGEAAEIVRAAGGIVVPPGDGKAIAAALRELAARTSPAPDSGEPAGRRYVRENFDRRRLAGEYLETLRLAAGEKTTRETPGAR